MSCFGRTYTKIGTIQRRLAWPLRKDDTQNREAFHIFCNRMEPLFLIMPNILASYYLKKDNNWVLIGFFISFCQLVIAAVIFTWKDAGSNLCHDFFPYINHEWKLCHKIRWFCQQRIWYVLTTPLLPKFHFVNKLSQISFIFYFSMI